ISASASATGASGGSVTGSTIIPASERLTRSTSATWSSIERLRWTTPMPPTRARAIASRASVTVSIAAETTGIASSIPRVSRVRVETSFGSTSDSAGTSRTSSNARPSRANFSSSARRRSTSRRPSSSPSKEESLSLGGDGLEVAELHVLGQLGGDAGVEAAGPELERRRGAGSDRRSQRVLQRPPLEPGGGEAGDEHVAAADRGDRLDLGRERAVAAHLAAVPEPGVAARLVRDQHVAGAELGDVLERVREVLLLVELLADERLGLALVRRDEKRLGLEPEPQRLALGVEHRRDLPPVQLADHLAVEAGVDAPRQRAGEHDEGGAAREVAQLVEQHVELFGADVRAPLVDLGVGAAGGVDDGGRGPRLLLDADEVVQDRLRRQLLDDPRARPAAGETGGDDRNGEALERPR